MKRFLTHAVIAMTLVVSAPALANDEAAPTPPTAIPAPAATVEDCSVWIESMTRSEACRAAASARTAWQSVSVTTPRPSAAQPRRWARRPTWATDSSPLA